MEAPDEVKVTQDGMKVAIDEVAEAACEDTGDICLLCWNLDFSERICSKLFSKIVSALSVVMSSSEGILSTFCTRLPK